VGGCFVCTQGSMAVSKIEDLNKVLMKKYSKYDEKIFSKYKIISLGLLHYPV
jgi:hypothetical protein